ncbi:hypothetical protein Taro_007008, partial [Colocasia esculenta]|nr:hypothetical protein [Colocasia esculenta]
MATSVARLVTSNEPVVSVDWLHANLGDPNLKVNVLGCYIEAFEVLDASWYMPDEKRDPLGEYQ